MNFGFAFQIFAAILLLVEGNSAATTTNQKFQKSTVDAAQWTANPALVKASVSICSVMFSHIHSIIEM